MDQTPDHDENEAALSTRDVAATQQVRFGRHLLPVRTDADAAILSEAVEWLETVESIGTETAHALTAVRDALACLEVCVDRGDHESAALARELLTIALLHVHSTHRKETGEISPDGSVTPAMFARKHVRPIAQRAQRLYVRRAGRTTIPRGRARCDRRRRRRVGARRAAGVRSGSDPGDPHRPSSRRRLTRQGVER